MCTNLKEGFRFSSSRLLQESQRGISFFLLPDSIAQNNLRKLNPFFSVGGSISLTTSSTTDTSTTDTSTMSSSISHNIKKRPNAKDVFITPKVLSKIHIDSIDYKDTDLWLDPCKNSGSYYNQFPTENKESCEILEGKDFFEYRGSPDIIIQNPPYSILDTWIKKNIELNPRVISMLIGIGNLTTRRIEWLEKAGYGLTKMKMLKVYKWYGMSMIVNFEKDKESIIEFDRTIYREDKVEEEPKKKNKKLVITKFSSIYSPPPPYVEEEEDV